MSQHHQRTIRAVVFDLDDTLYPERDYVLSGYRAVGEYLRRTLGREEMFEDILWDRFITGQSSNAFDYLNEHMHLALTPENISELVKVYREHRPTLQPLDGIDDLLTRLRKKYRLGLLSDGFLPAQRLKLQATGLSDHFQAVIFTEEMGRECWKPSPRGFEEIARRLDTPHASCVYVGDNPTKDFVAPNALGWLTVQFHFDGQIHAHKPAPAAGQPQIVAGSIAELSDLLA